MRSGIWAVVLSVSGVGCAHMIPVAALESAIRDAAQAAQRAVGPAADTVKVEVSVVTATTAGTTLPIPVVPLDIEHTRTQTTTLTINIDLKKFKPPLGFMAQPSRYLLNVKTGELTEVTETPPHGEK
jgi:hypothetical protein